MDLSQEPIHLHFFLNEAEFQEAASNRKVLSTHPYFKTLSRIVAACGVVFFSWIPYQWYGSWSAFAKREPVLALGFSALIILDFWVATGLVGVRTLNRIFNRLNVERHILLSDSAVESD